MPRNDKSLVFALSQDYARATGGYVYDRRLLQELERLGWTVQRLTLPAGFPRPSATARTETAALLAGLSDGTLVISDQLCFSVLPELMRAEAARLRLAIIVHHPLALEGYRSEAAAQLRQREAAALAEAALVIATSPTTERSLHDDYGVAEDRLLVAPPGSDPQPEAAGSTPLRLLGIGAVVPRKGHDLLVRALARVRDLPWQARLIGNLDRDHDHVARVRALIADGGLSERISLPGELPTLEAEWAAADICVSASHHEGYGMVLAEAVARVLPIVATRAGAVEDWLAPGAALLVPPGDVDALAAALRQAIGDAGERARLRQTARALRSMLPRWTDTAAAVDAQLSLLCGLPAMAECTTEAVAERCDHVPPPV